MKQALWIGLLILLSIGCAKPPEAAVSGPKNPSPSPSPGNQESKVDVITDTHVCDEPAPPKPTVLGTWKADFQQEQGFLHKTVTVSSQSISSRLECQVGNITVEATASSPILMVQNQIQILMNDKMDHYYDNNGIRFHCISALEKGDIMTFSFKGPCLNVKTEERDILMIPVKAHFDIDNENQNNKDVL